MLEPGNRRILLVDDTPAIHQDFRKILASAIDTGNALDEAEAALFGATASAPRLAFELDSAFQGQEGQAKVAAALVAGKPFAMAFVDMRMPPGWDGLETVDQLWRVDPELQVVICTAYSDQSWQEVLGRLDTRDRLLILKKPFDGIEVWQLASSLTMKWDMTRQARLQMDALEDAVRERTRELSQEIIVRQQAQAALQSANASLQESEERYRLLVELSPDAIVVERGGHIVFANSAACALYRAKQVEDLLGLAISSLMPPGPAARAGAGGGSGRGESEAPMHTEEQAVCLDGSQVAVLVTRLAFSANGQPAVQLVVRDISERKRAQEKLQYQATHDLLTGLPNRGLFMDRLNLAIAQARRHGGKLAVCFIDLDRFKWINDSLGHASGDELLKTVAQRLTACLRQTDTVARLGGDEFVLLLESPGPPEETEATLKRVVASIAQSMSLAGREISVTCSMGCSRYPEDGQDSDELLKFADAAMYRAKEAGRNNLQVYNPELHRHLDDRQAMLNDLRHAMDRGQLTLYYQPQIDLSSGAVAGVEALMRWHHPELGEVPPSRFIPLAEEAGLIDQLGGWALRQACMQNKAWQLAGLPHFCVAVNVSPKQVEQPGLEQLVADCLAASGLEPRYLELELTESAAMRDLDKTVALLHGLKRLGVRLAIDDFGTGYSNLRSLACLPLDKLKLDGSFVKDIVTNPGSLTVARTIVSMAHQLGLKIVAEMAETEGQVTLLADGTCDQVQGYYFSTALPPEELGRLVGTGALIVPGGKARRGGSRTLLVLDDDPAMARSVKRALKFDGYRVLLANRANEAFELLASNDVGVMLCDQRLQETTGLEMLNKAKRLFPETVRLLFSGYREYEVLTAAINDGVVHKFLNKPLDNHELRAAVADAFLVYENRGMEASHG